MNFINFINVTNALDIVIDPIVFYKTPQGIKTLTSKTCIFSSTNSTCIRLEIDRRGEKITMHDSFYRPNNYRFASFTFEPDDVLNLYVDTHDLCGNDIYNTVATISWLKDTMPCLL